MKLLPIPLTWNAEQALTVAEFLQEAVDTIWYVHGDAMELLLAERRGPPPGALPTDAEAARCPNLDVSR